MGDLKQGCIHHHGSQIKMEMRIARRPISCSLAEIVPDAEDRNTPLLCAHACNLPPFVCSPLSFPPACASTNKWSCPANTSRRQEWLTRLLLKQQENGTIFTCALRAVDLSQHSEGILIKSERLPIKHGECCVTAERDGSLECLSKGSVVAR